MSNLKQLSSYIFKSSAVVILLSIVLQVSPALANDYKYRGCSVRDLAGKWVFYTDVGTDHQLGGVLITALGTMNIDYSGNVEGTFDVNAEQLFTFSGLEYFGEASINSNCMGTLVFQTNAPSERTDSILLINRHTIQGMSITDGVIWTYTAKRIQGHPLH